MTARAGSAGSPSASPGARESGSPSTPDLAGGAAGLALVDPGRPAVVRWTSRAHSIDELTRELARMWASDPQVPAGDSDETHVQARTSVLNLMVVARRPEMGQSK